MEYPTVFVVLLGLGTVFVGLIMLVFMTQLMGWVIQQAEKKTTKTAEITAESPKQIDADEANRIAAAVSAAIAEELGTDITGIRIISMKRI